MEIDCNSIEEDFNYTDMYEVIRSESNDLAEDIELIDEFYNKKKNRQSLCYRIFYRSHERNLLKTVPFPFQDDV